MNSGKTVFAQLMDYLPMWQFHACVERYNGEHKVKSFSCLDQFLAMAFAQLTGRESLRDIEATLAAASRKLYHMGFRSPVRRNTLANANQARDCRIFEDLARALIRMARPLYAGEALDVDLKETIYALDATTIDLCLSLFPWAKFRSTKGAVKLHTLLDVRGAIPCEIRVTPGREHETSVLGAFMLEAGAIYLVDRGYVDYAWFRQVHEAGAWFITRAKSNMDARRMDSRQVDKSTGLRSDQDIVFRGHKASRYYPDRLRRIHYRDDETQKDLVFLTNNFALPALTIVQLYKLRWKVELFFKWIKQHLRIKTFFGTSPNAVKTQVWIAISVYVLVAIMKKRLGLPHSLYTILQVLGAVVFEKMALLQAFRAIDPELFKEPEPIQLNLFN